MNDPVRTLSLNLCKISYPTLKDGNDIADKNTENWGCSIFIINKDNNQIRQNISINDYWFIFNCYCTYVICIAVLNIKNQNEKQFC